VKTGQAYLKQQSATRQAPRAFTLVELLVVIAIISILAGLLLPALEQAIASARVISCQNTERQYMLAMSLYANDFKAYPYNNSGGSSTGDKLIANGYVPKADQLYCPEVLPWGSIQPFNYHYNETHYVCRNDIVGCMGGWGPNWYNDPLPMSALKNPSATNLGGDAGLADITVGKYTVCYHAGGDNSSRIGAILDGWNGPVIQYDRHDATPNLFFADGHVKGYAAPVPVLGP